MYIGYQKRSACIANAEKSMRRNASASRCDSASRSRHAGADGGIDCVARSPWRAGKGRIGRSDGAWATSTSHGMGSDTGGASISQPSSSPKASASTASESSSDVPRLREKGDGPSSAAPVDTGGAIPRSAPYGTDAVRPH